MTKYRFTNDYSEGAHPQILELLAQTNLDQEEGYGNDSLSQMAEGLLKAEIGNPQAAVHFVSGGTQANLIVLASMLKPYEAVIAAATGHIFVHEAGAIEATGHKINVVSAPSGKLTADQVRQVVAQHTDEHMVKPRVVFISHPTELGTTYTKRELESLASVCRQNQLYLYLDGARLGSALVCAGADVTLADLGRLVDVFYIGGTKNGALLGEAIVINHPALQSDFRFHIKQRGGLLAKGSLLGAQFVGLFRDGLYFELARYGTAMAQRLAAGLKALGFRFFTDSATNMIFPIFPNALVRVLEDHYTFYVRNPVDEDHSVIRLVTSWATPVGKVDELLETVGEWVKMNGGQ
jgi:threonine aldolase